MKHLHYLSKFVFAGAFLIGYTQAFADPVTFNFSLPGTTGGLDEENTDNGVALDLTGDVTFDGTNVSLFVKNGTDPDSTITQVYLLKPGGIDATTLDSTHAGNSWALQNSLSSQGNGNGNGNGNQGGPLDSILSSLDLESGDYFGAATATNDKGNLTADESGSFSFTMVSDLDTEFNDWIGYANSTVPQFLVRWMSVGEDDDFSGAGYANITAVPEPALIAPLGLAGIGCLLVVRRRLRAKVEAAKS